jgi:anti-anti-sigma factor
VNHAVGQRWRQGDEEARVDEGHWSVDSDGVGHVVRLRGSIDLASEDQLVADMESLFSGDDLCAELDLRDVDFMDSSGLRAMLVLHHRYPGRMVLGAVSPQVQRLLELTGALEALRPR